MNTNTIDTAETPETSARLPKGKRSTAKKAKSAKKARQSKKPAGKPKAERANKRAEVIALSRTGHGTGLGAIWHQTIPKPKCSGGNEA